MGYWLGIDVGSTCVSAAVCRAGLAPELVTLGSGETGSDVVSSAVCVGAEGDVVVGEGAGERVEGDPDRVVRGFVGRVGDEVPMVVGGVPYSAAGVLALVVRWVVDRVAESEGGPAAGVVVTHPVGWGAYKVGVVAEALAGVGMPGVRLCSEPVAAAVRYGAREQLSAGVVAVYDLGGASCDAAVIQKDRSGRFSVIGQPARLGHVGGVDFDDAVFGRVVNAVPEWGGLDAEDPGVLAAGLVLRRECRGAKEVLSVDTEVRIPVVGPGVESSVRLVRAEFEELVRAQVVETLEVLRGVLGSAGVSAADVDAVLLVGGSARVPLVSQVVSAELGCPVVVDGDCQVAVAMGAAVYARSLDSPEPPDSTDTDSTDTDSTDTDSTDTDSTDTDSTDTDSTDTDSAATDSAGAGAVIAASDAGNDVLVRNGVGSGTAAGPRSESGGLADAQRETPRRPVLSVAPLDVPPAEQVWREERVRRVRRIAVAGGLAVLTAAGVATVAFLTSRNGPTPPAAAATPPAGVPHSAALPAPGAPNPGVPAPGGPPNPAAGLAANTGQGSADRPGNDGVVRTAPPGAPKAPRGAAARPAPGAPPDAAAPTWATRYTWTTSWSSPPPATPDPTTTSERPSPTTTERPPPPTTTKEVPPPRTATATPSSTDNPPHHRRPST